MKITLTLILLLFLSQSCFAQNSNFHENVLDDFKIGGARNFIALQIESNSYNGKALITNGDLFIFLKKEKGIDAGRYENFVKEILSGNKKLLLGNTKIEESDFIPVEQNQDVKAVAAKGRKEFLNHYFDGSRFKFEIVEKTKNIDLMYTVANQLFEWQIASYIDDTSGVLAIRNFKTLNKQY